jgi:hypothetical protein
MLLTKAIKANGASIWLEGSSLFYKNTRTGSSEESFCWRV